MTLPVQLKTYTRVILFIMCLSFLISFILWTSHFPGIRRIFVFENADTRDFIVETRYLSIENNNEKFANYIREILLGPVSEHSRPVFNKHTKLLSCIKRDNHLYVNLSKEALQDLKEGDNFQINVELFKKNIFLNFKNIESIDVFVEGNILYQEELEK